MPMSQGYKDRLYPYLPAIAQHYGTPFHIYDEAGIRETGRQLKEAFADIPSWKRFCDLPRLTNLVVVNRHDAGGNGMPQAHIKRYFPEYELASAGLWQAAGQGDIMLLAMPRVDISSTMVRDLVRCRRDISPLVPARVAEVIRRYGLYG